MATAINVPPNADKLLFAVDVVGCLLNAKCPHMSSQFRKSDIVVTSERYRVFIRSDFDETVRSMILDINDTQMVLIRKDFYEMKQNGRVNRDSLIEYDNTCRVCYFAEGYQARSFLMYSSRIAAMACYFFLRGVDDALDIAVDLIMSALPEENVSSFIRNTLDATNYSRREPITVGSSESEGSSNDSTSNSESDANLAEKPLKNLDNTLNPESQDTPSTSQTPNISVETSTASMSNLNVMNTACADPGSSESITDAIEIVQLAEKDGSPSSSGSSVSTWKTQSTPSKNITAESSKHTSSLGKRLSPSNFDEYSITEDVPAARLDTESAGEVPPASGVKKIKFHETEQNM